MNTFDELDELIRDNSVFCITTHVNPDGDSIGSEIALKRFLESRGKSAFIVNASAIPPELSFMDPEDSIITVGDGRKVPECDILFSLDTALIARFEKLETVMDLHNMNIYPVDHHVPDKKSLGGCVDPEASSTGEILFRYFSRVLKNSLSPGLAEPLFYAIASDTGWMQFTNTSPAIPRILADLADTAGLQFDAAYNRLKNNWSCDKFRLYIEVLSSLDISDGVCAFIHCDQDTFEEYPSLNNVSHSTEAFVEHLKHISEREVYALLKQKEDRSGYRVSLRSRGIFNVQKLAAAFGGGGHILASGCTIDMPEIADVKQTIRKQLAEQEERIFDF